MPITAAQIESNGWVLRLTLTGALTSPNTDFSAYTFDMNGTPRLTLTTVSAGFVKSGGTAVAGNMTRSIIGLKPLRNPAAPINSGVLNPKTLDEVDLGGGSIRVRIALSEMVYSSDTGLSLAVLAGWRSGEGAASGISVTNSSTLAPPLPIMRWVLPPYEVATGSFRLSLIVGSHHPVGFDPVAGVKFTVTDGANTKTAWAMALADDNTYGDNLRCHSVMIDPATATALTAGLLRCDAEVYPYLGAMRSTDPAGTKVVANLAVDGLLSQADAPFVIGYDPAGTKYSNVYAYIDPVNGTNVPAGVMIATTRALAKAVTPASRPRNIVTAQHACRLFNRSFSSRGGVSYGAAGGIDGLVCTLAVGTHSDGLGTTTATLSSSGRTSEIPMTIEGDPTDSNPRANCILQTRTAAAQANNACSRVRFRNMTLEQGEASLFICQNRWLDNVEIRAKSGFAASTVSPVTGAPYFNGYSNWWITRSKIWRTAWKLGYSASTHAPHLIRATEVSRQIDGIVFVKNRFIGSAEDGTTGIGAVGFGMHSASTLWKSKEDIVAAYNDCRYIFGKFLFTYNVDQSLTGLRCPSHTRHLIMNNLLEYIFSDQGSMLDYGENEQVIMSQIIIEGNTASGAGINMFYNEPPVTVLADATSRYNETFNNVMRNNALDRNASKHDEFIDPDTLSVRPSTSPWGYRPQLVQCWAEHNGVNMEGHVDVGRSGSISAFRRDGVGPRSIQFDTITNPNWTDDRSYNANPANTGGGNYTPTAASPALNRIIRANSDRDLIGKARRMNGASGALEAIVFDVTGQGARHLHRASVSQTSLALPTLPSGARHGQMVSTSLAGWSTTLASATTLLAGRASSALLTSAANIAPNMAVFRLASQSPALDATDPSLLLVPGQARLVLIGAAARLLPKMAAGVDQTLLVRSDARTIFITQTEQEL